MALQPWTVSLATSKLYTRAVLPPARRKAFRMTKTTEPKSERVDLRMTPTAKDTLQRAAALNDKTLTEFVLDSSLWAAFETLADRRVLQLDEVQWAAFMASLDVSPKDTPRLRKLLTMRAPWDPEKSEVSSWAGGLQKQVP
jgi:uncharacterized protein (DUF1778 family)